MTRPVEPASLPPNKREGAKKIAVKPTRAGDLVLLLATSCETPMLLWLGTVLEEGLVMLGAIGRVEELLLLFMLAAGSLLTATERLNAVVPGIGLKEGVRAQG